MAAELGGRARQRTDPSKRDGSHHVASVTGQEDTQSGIDEMHGTAQDHIELKIDFFGCVICHLGGDSHPCIADQNFQTLWPLGSDAFAQVSGFGRHGEIASHRNRLASQGGCRLIGQFLGTVHGYDSITAAGETLCDLGADARCCAGDDCQALGHGWSPIPPMSVM